MLEKIVETRQIYLVKPKNTADNVILRGSRVVTSGHVRTHWRKCRYGVTASGLKARLQEGPFLGYRFSSRLLLPSRFFGLVCFWVLLLVSMSLQPAFIETAGATPDVPSPINRETASADASKRPKEPGVIQTISWEIDSQRLLVTVKTSISMSCLATTLNRTQDHPFRIVLDCEGVLPGSIQPVIPVGEGVLQRIRVGVMSQSPPKTRIVLDLSSPSDYDVAKLPGGAGVSVSITEGTGEIKSVFWSTGEQDGSPVLRVEGTSPLPFESRRMHQPERFVIDIPGVTLSDETPRSLASDVPGVLRVRLGQFQTNPAVARVVVDLDAGDGLPGLPEESPVQCEVVGTETGLAVYFYSRLVSAFQRNHEDTSALTISTTAPVKATVKSGGEGTPEGRTSGAHIVIDVPFVALGQPAIEFTPESLGSGEVQRLVAEEVRYSPTGVRLSIWLCDANTPFRVLSRGENGSIVLEFERAQPLRGKRIIVDPGHGGSDPGCISYSGLYEKHLTMSVAGYLIPKLERSGAQVIATRTGDETVNVYERVDLANRAGGDIYVSLHMNSFRTSQKSGVEVYYYSNVAQARRLALSIHSRLLEKTGFTDSGIRTARFVVLKGTSMPAVVCEMGYLSNPDNERFLRNKGFHEILAQAVYEGICDYFSTGGSESERLSRGRSG